MKDHLVVTIQGNIVQGLRELFDRVERDDDWRALGALSYLEGYVLAMMKDLTKRKESRE